MNTEKLVYSLMGGLLFVLLASPFAFNITQTLIANPLGYAFERNGTPTPLGLSVHGVVYVLIVRLMMN